MKITQTKRPKSSSTSSGTSTGTSITTIINNSSNNIDTSKFVNIDDNQTINSSKEFAEGLTSGNVAITPMGISLRGNGDYEQQAQAAAEKKQLAALHERVNTNYNYRMKGCGSTEGGGTITSVNGNKLTVNNNGAALTVGSKLLTDNNDILTVEAVNGNMITVDNAIVAEKYLNITSGNYALFTNSREYINHRLVYEEGEGVGGYKYGRLENGVYSPKHYFAVDYQSVTLKVDGKFGMYGENTLTIRDGNDGSDITSQYALNVINPIYTTVADTGSILSVIATHKQDKSTVKLLFAK